MRLEDALLYMVIEPGLPSAQGLGEFCAAAIAGGVDAVRLDAALSDSAVDVAAACASEDAIFIVGGDAEKARSVNADGVHFSSQDDSIGIARAVMGLDAIVGLDVNTPDEALLGLEVGADYLVYGGGTQSPALFASIGSVGTPLFAGGIDGVESAAIVVDGGVYRLCIGSSVLSGTDVTGQAAEYSRLLGRCI